ncbi:salivary glue protein Sgs-3-like [Pecten maximus]|uniref:salivary glue protein Sgs-3-like n=1 Tax=Pecten maximus TaxID=6579 RepID=UPI0014587CDD|nr:salivary glue protein Sgs-3-like [Pecten maximus]
MLWNFLTSILLLANYPGGYSQCQSGAELYYLFPHGDICYWILSLYSPRNAADSETGCRSENGELAYIPNIYALITVMQLLLNNNANVSGWYAYLGYSRVTSSTTLLEIQNSGVYQTWIPWDQVMGQPLQSSLGCIALHGTSGLWHDMHCANNIRAICSTPYHTDTTQAPTITSTTTRVPTTTTTTTQEPTTTTTTTQEPITTTTTTTQEPTTTTTTTTQEPTTTTTTTTQEPTTTTTTTTQEPTATTTTTTQEPTTTTTTTTQEPTTTTTTTQEPTTTTTTTQESTTTTSTTQEPTTTTTTTREPTTTTTTQEPTTTTTQPPTTTATTKEPKTTTTTTTDVPTTTTTTTDEPTTTTTTTQDLTTSRITIEELSTSSHTDCVCPCDHSPHTEFFSTVNMTEELQAKLDSLKEETKVDEETLSSTIRKRTSAHDPRPSSTYVGYLGIALLSFIFGGLILADLLSVIITLKLIL